MPGKYNEQAGNQKARDFFQFYFSSIFPWKQPGATLVVARENPQAPALNDSPAYVAVSRLCRLLEINPNRASCMDTIWCSTVLNGVCRKEKLTVKCGLYIYCLIYLFPRFFSPKWAKWDLTLNFLCLLIQIILKVHVCWPSSWIWNQLNMHLLEFS